MKYKIKFTTIEQVKNFTNKMVKIETDALIRSENNKYSVDAKSIMGIFSLDLSRNLLLEIDDDDAKEILNIIKELGILVA